MQKIAVIVTVCDRPEYVERCFETLKNVDFKGVELIIVDDASTRPLPHNIFCDNMLVHTKRTGIKGALLTGIEHAIAVGCDLFINLDSDTIVAPDFIDRLMALHNRYPTKLISGFNSNTQNRNPVLIDKEDFVVKRYCNGVNMCFDLGIYYTHIKPALKGGGNWDFEASKGMDFSIIAKPSVVQHIGYISSMGHDEIPDYSHDLKEIVLPDVTLFGIDGRNPVGITRAAEISQMNIKFGEVKIITQKLFDGHMAYSDFCINKMPGYITTSHALIIHADGYVLKPEAWQHEWLQYDYIGAVWEWYKDEHKNGNGGFNLRSKRLMEAVKRLAPTVTHPEDSVICRDLRLQLEAMGMRFAPLDVCRAFSIEAYGAADKKYRGQFGFHGYNVDMSFLPKWLQLPKRRVPTYPRKYGSTKR